MSEPSFHVTDQNLHARRPSALEGLLLLAMAMAAQQRATQASCYTEFECQSTLRATSKVDLVKGQWSGADVDGEKEVRRGD